MNSYEMCLINCSTETSSKFVTKFALTIVRQAIICDAREHFLAKPFIYLTTAKKKVARMAIFKLINYL